MDEVKRGRPSTGTAKTNTELQRLSRARKRAERHEDYPPIQIGMMLSAEASQSLRMLREYADKSQKTIIEELLISAYKLQRENLPKE